jgi:Cof subfamily protein (haloacid dehalogenase superfamily)
VVRLTPPSAPRLVATDLDGTVLRTDGSISERTVRALRRVEESGATVVFVTGRPTRWMREVADATGHTGVAVCANGAVIYDLHTERVLQRFEMSGEVAREVVALLRGALPDIALAIETMDGLAHEPAFPLRYAVVPPPAVRPVTELVDGPVIKLLVRHPRRDSDNLLAAAREVVGDLVEVTHSTRGPALLELSAAGVSKATTLARLCDERRVEASQVVAFGDMPNDLPLLAWAGTAYAVANAHPTVLAAVPRRTDSNDDDGVARVLEELYGVPTA